jgi:hypothetical protein
LAADVLAVDVLVVDVLAADVVPERTLAAVDLLPNLPIRLNNIDVLLVIACCPANALLAPVLCFRAVPMVVTVAFELVLTSSGRS